MGAPSSINRQVLRKLCAKFDTFVTSVTIRPIFCTKRPDYERKSPVRTVTAQRLVTTLYHQVEDWLKCAYELELEGL